MCINVKCMISYRLWDIIGCRKCGEKYLQKIELLEECNISKWISFFEYFCNFVFDAFFGYITDKIVVFLHAMPRLCRKIE